MIVKVDTRETELITTIQKHMSINPSFSNIQLKVETLPIGDVIICNDTEDLLIIERKSLNDLLSSIKDGRYEEQSYRLNGLNHHNHNIIYLIEGDVNKLNPFKTNVQAEKTMLYSSMFSLNYYKGFSVFRSFNMDETAVIICSMVNKMTKEETKKKPFYREKKELKELKDDSNKDNKEGVEEATDQVLVEAENVCTEKDYVNVVKKVKKENITPGNIGEIILSQIPGISSITALAIMEKYPTIATLIKELESNPDCLNGISYANAKGQVRKINKTCIANLIKFLLPQ